MTVETAVIGARTTITRPEEDEEDDLVQEEDEEGRVNNSEAPVRDFDWLTDQLAVGGRLADDSAADLAAQGIGAVVDLRDEECDDEEALARAGIDFLHLPTPDLEPASPEALERGVAFVRERIARGEKVLIHCQHGIGRSALLALCVMVELGFEPLEAIRHAKQRRERVSPSPSQFSGWCAWLRSRGSEAPTMHDFGCIAYRRISTGG
jgi:protein tyrosine phosphatase (PTP) superfamily phosphohydrolase (DUF442 family)